MYINLCSFFSGVFSHGQESLEMKEYSSFIFPFSHTA